MSLFSTIAHEGRLSRMVFSHKVVGTIVGAAVLVTAGLFVINDSTDESPATAPAVGNRLSHEEFVRINTTALPDLPAVDSQAATPGRLSHDEFVRINTSALPNVAPSQYAEPASGPR